MATAILSTKGQITIPAAVREKLGVTTGDRVEFVELADGQIALVPAVEDVRTLKGMVRKPRRPISVEEMHRIVRKRAAER
jgi:AbrB family looped-hinge helix DNA binding protein